MKIKVYAKFWGTNKVFYGRCDVANCFLKNVLVALAVVVVV